MALLNHPQWDHIRSQYEAWWDISNPDRPLLLQITAPCCPTAKNGILSPALPGENRWAAFTDPGVVTARLEKTFPSTRFFADAFPTVFPVSTNLAAIQAAFLGCPYQITPNGETAWADPILHAWDAELSLAIDPANEWWQITQRLLRECTPQFAGKALIGLPDLQGGGEILALLRGTENLVLDLYDHPHQIAPAIEAINKAWFAYFQICCEIIHQHSDGYIDWLNIWSDRPAVTVECDFSVLISPAMFRSHFLPGLRQQIDMVERSIYHLDGPEQMVHLNMLLAIPNLHGIQWVPKPGQSDPLDWLHLFKKVQAAGKNLVLACPPERVVPLLHEIRPEGVLLSIACQTITEANCLLDQVKGSFGLDYSL
jgi:hypothetical protein